MIEVHDVTFAYPEQPPLLKNVSLTIAESEYIALTGPNGSGKTTLALLLKGLIAPNEGTITIDGIEARDEVSRFEVMKLVGIVFQNPDNTIVTTTVESELAFGLENLGVPQDEMKRRVNAALRRFDLEQYRHTNPTNLSGGEKQRLALASVMIMKPSYLILDEPTAFLDPQARMALLDSIRAEVDDGAAVLHITQFSDEAEHADRVIELDASGIILDGKPEEVLPRARKLRSWRRGYPTPGNGCIDGDVAPGIQTGDRDRFGNLSLPPLVALENVGYRYDRGTPFEKGALEAINLAFHPGSSTAFFGQSGSGKTTLLEIIAGLTVPSAGTVLVNNDPLRAMAFQTPEDQLFGETVAVHVLFGPHNCGVSGHRLDDRVTEALNRVGLDPVRYGGRDTSTLSGGEKRRVALAGVLAMNPDVLVLDEPTAGLDRSGMEIVIGILSAFRKHGGMLIFSTHDLEVARCLGTDGVVLKQGRVETCGQLDRVIETSPWIRSFRTA